MTTRIWFENDAIQVDGLEAQAARSLYTVLDGDRVHVFTLSGVRLSQLRFDQYAKKDGTGFASATAAKAYLDGELAKTATPAWDVITGKPSTFPPSAHTHAWTEITGKPSTFPPSAHTHLWADITDKPTAFPPAAHTHSGLLQYIGDINVAETLLVSLAVGMKRKAFTLAGVAVGDKLAFVATGAPTSGCEAVNVYPAGANSVSVGYYTPLLAIGASYSMPISVYRIMP